MVGVRIVITPLQSLVHRAIEFVLRLRLCVRFGIYERRRLKIGRSYGLCHYVSVVGLAWCVIDDDGLVAYKVYQMVASYVDVFLWCRFGVVVGDFYGARIVQ